jgi:hypothetical protein
MGVMCSVVFDGMICAGLLIMLSLIYKRLRNYVLGARFQ